ncbi:MAG TPA: YggT family protein [Rectinemataceae bacterium]
MVLAILARILGALCSLYMLICSARVLTSWVPGLDIGKGGAVLASLADPYLHLFSRFRIFRTERFDFSPIAALAILSVANNMFTTLALTGSISVGFLLSLLLGAAWSAFAFILSFLSACALVRVVVYLARWNSLHPIWVVLDAILNPVLRRINSAIYKNKAIDYLQGLITGFLVLILARTIGGTAVKLLSRLLIGLPF